MKYITFLRGINVSGQKLIKMEELRKVFEDMGFKNVRSYIQSGNVIFESAKANPESLRNKIEKLLCKIYGYEVTAVIRTIPEIEKVVKGYPFSKVKGKKECKIYVSFLTGKPDKNAVKELTTLNNNDEIFHAIGNNVYCLNRKGYVDSLLGKNILEKKLKVKATVRNWNTVNKILKI